MADDLPPDLPGYDHLRPLGRGGFADVHLYRQHLPSREVAVKVLRAPTRTAADRAQFENETNRMAMLSSHPGIVTIYEVGVAPDGRPFLTMEYCPNDHYGRIARARPLTVAGALGVGIKVAAAVETAHRASILHRDIKPANVLLTTYGEPALTDFGIAGGGEGEVDEGHGVSIPFAAPEVLSGATSGDERADVYSLGATVYALLAGRAPFSSGEPTTDAQLVQKVLAAPLPATGRSDLPPSLEHVLATALARDPQQRYQSAAELGRALQGIEAELGLAQTPLRIAERPATPVTTPPDDDDTTRFRSLPRVDPDGPAAPTDGRGSAPGSPPPVLRRAGAPGVGDGGLGDRTVHRGEGPRPVEAAAEDDGPAEEPAATGGRRRLVAIAGAVVVLAVIGLLVAQIGGDGGQASTTTTAPEIDPLVLGGALGRPDRVQIAPTEGGGQVVTWAAPAAAEGDTYQVSFTDGPAELRDESTVVADRQLRVETDRRVCVVVQAIRGGQVSAESTEVCSR